MGHLSLGRADVSAVWPVTLTSVVSGSPLEVTLDHLIVVLSLENNKLLSLGKLVSQLDIHSLLLYA